MIFGFKLKTVKKESASPFTGLALLHTWNEHVSVKLPCAGKYEPAPYREPGKRLKTLPRFLKGRGEMLEEEKKRCAELLAAKGICPGDCFRLVGKAVKLFRLTESLELENEAGIRTIVSENELWELWEQIERVPRSVFNRARKIRWEQDRHNRGLPGEGEIRRMAQNAADAYADGRPVDWQAIASFDEESIRLVALLAAELTAKRLGWKAPERKRFAAAFFHDAVWAKMTGERQ